MNDLVAAPSAGAAWNEIYKSMGIIGPISDTVDSVNSGDCFGTLSGAVSTALDVAAAIADPIAALMSSVASVMLDYMWPLPQLLDELVGNPQAVEGMARTWGNISGQLTTARDDLVSAVSSVLAGWEGPAAAAYQKIADGFAEVVGKVQATSSAVGAGLQTASAIVGLIRSIVKQLIADLVGQIISKFVETVATAGAGAVVAVPQLVIKIAEYAKKASDWIKQLNTAITGFMTAADDINNVMRVAVPALKNFGETLTVITISNVIADVHDFVVDSTQPTTT